ncbi:MAG: 2-dehydro-3-deoxygluconokinase [Chloroflexota bacterium]|nr:MAG: 2-dehydro-3-deoxygluconokinase [Chloroflexota bacterium]
MTRFDVTTIGEGQLRYCVPAGTRLEQAPQFDVYVTGTEANVACLLSRLGWRAGWVSALPDNPLGRRVINEYRLAGLDTSAVRWMEGGRLATYYVEFAVPPRSTQVFFDRQNTCFTTLTPADIDWDYLLDTRLLHLSGLTVPLSPSVGAVVREALQRAKAAGIPVSFDVNYRERLWTPEQAAAALAPFVRQVDLLFCGRSDAQRLFGCSGSPEEIIQGLARWTDAAQIVTTLSADGVIGWDRQRFIHVPAREVVILDRIGAGDALVGGVLHGWLGGDFARGLRCGALTAAMALSVYGDQVYTSAAELETLLDAPWTDIRR